MIKPTFTDPDFIIEVPSDGNTERPTSHLYVKAFIGKDGKKRYFFKSVTIKKDGLEINISNHFDRAKRLREALEKGKLLYRFDGGAQTEQRPADVSVTASADENQGSSAGKGSGKTANDQGKGEKVAENEHPSEEKESASDAKEQQNIEAQIKHLEEIKNYPGADKKLVQAEIDRLKGLQTAAIETDKQGNPVDSDGKLITDKVASIDDITDEDFSKPTRSVELPQVPENVDNALGADGKPVIIKKNIFEKNKANHPELKPSQSRKILKDALYSTNLYGQTQPKSRPNYWVVIRTSDPNKVVVLEVSENKDNVEIVGWRYAGERQLEELRKQAEREDGQLLILTSEKEAAAGLSTLPRNLSSAGKDNKSSDTKQGEAGKKEQKASSRTSEPTQREAALRDELNELLREAGMPVIDDVEGGQQVLDMANDARLMSFGEPYDYEKYPLGRVEPGISNKKVDVVATSSNHGFANYKEAKAWAKENVVKTYNTEETGGKGEVRISNGAVDKFLSQSAVDKSDSKDVHLAVLKVLPEVLKESIDVETHPDFLKGEDGKRSADNGINKDVLVHRCYGAVSIDGKLYRVKITLKEDVRNKRLPSNTHSYEATKIELLAGTLAKPEGDNPNTNNSISAVNLLENVGLSYNPSEKVLDASEKRTKSIREQRVYHGSGAEFDHFDTMNHMGEGEGSQAFGAGTYVSDQKGIGLFYAKIGARDRVVVNGKEYIFGRSNNLSVAQNIAAGTLYNAYYGRSGSLHHKVEIGEKDYVQRAIQEIRDTLAEKPDRSDAADYIEAEKLIESGEVAFKHRERVLYTVEIPDDNGKNYLDWNAKVGVRLLNKVNKHLEQQGKKPINPELSKRHKFLDGNDLYRALSIRMPNDDATFNDDKAASEFLSSLGFVGIKYPAGSIHGGAKEGDTDYVIFNDKDLKITDKVKFFRTANGEAYGFTVGGKIYIDPRIATSETPIHEYTHLWAEALRKVNPKEWQNVVKLMKGTWAWDYVKRLYPELKTDDEIAEEALAHYSGRRGAERLREAAREEADKANGVMDKAAIWSAFAKIKDALEKYWKHIAEDILHIHFTTAEEVADKVMYDLLNKVKPGTFNLSKSAEERVGGNSGMRGVESSNDGKLAVTRLPSDTNLPLKTYEGKDCEVSVGEALTAINNLRGDYVTLDGHSLTSSKDTRRKLGNVLRTGKDNDDLRVALSHVPEILSSSVLVEEHRDRTKVDGVRKSENPSDPNIEKVQVYYGPVKINGKLYRVKTTVPVFMTGNNRIRGYEIGNMELSSPTPTVDSQGVGRLRTSSISLANLLKNVEFSYEKGKKLLDEIDKNLRFREDDARDAAQRMDENNGTEVVRFVDFLRRGRLEQGESRYFHVGETGDILNEHGISGKITIGTSAVNSHHNEDADHLDENDWVEVIEKINEPVAITEYGDRGNSFRIYTIVEKNGKNICVGVDVNSVGRDVNITNIRTAFARDIANALNERLVYPHSRTELETAIRELSLRHNREVYPEQPYDAANIRNNSETQENDSNAMVDRVTELSERLHTPVRIIRTEEEVAALPSVRQRRMKGSFNPMTGDVTIVVPNNANMADVENTVVHEVVGHDGLRVLFPDEAKRNNALDELYRVSNVGIQQTIDRMAQKTYDAEVDRLREKKRREHEAKGEDANASYYADMAEAHAEANKKREKFKRDATEEYGAKLAGRIGESGFEKMSADELKFWGKLRAMLQKALQRLLDGLKIPGRRKWSDKEWAFVLHEAYKRKKNGGHPTVFDAADTEVMRRKTGFGEMKFSDGKREQKSQVATTIADMKQRVTELFEKAKTGEFVGKPASIGRLSADGKAYLEKLSGLKFKEFVDFVLNPSDLNHIRSDHYGENEKDKGNNVPLTDEDIQNMVDVLNQPDGILYGVDKKDGRKLFFFLKDAGNGLYNLTEVCSTKKGNLTAKSFFKSKKKGIIQRVMEIKDSLLPTSVTYSGEFLSSDAKIPTLFEINEGSSKNVADEGIMFRDGDMGLDETITKMKVEASQANADNWQAKQEAMKAIGGNLPVLRLECGIQAALILEPFW